MVLVPIMLVNTTARVTLAILETTATKVFNNLQLEYATKSDQIHLDMFI